MKTSRSTKAFAIAALYIVQGRPGSAAAHKPVTVPWKLCVVTRLVSGHQRYVGTAPATAIGAALQTGILPGGNVRGVPAGINRPYRIWLIGDGVSAGVAYSPALGRFDIMQGRAVTASTNVIGAALARLLQSATKVSGQLWPRLPGAPSIAVGDGPAPPPTLAEQLNESVLVVTGTVAGILRVAHSPQNTNFPEQHTVFVVAVDRTLHCPNGVSAPGVVKVVQDGGNLPWTDPNSGLSGTGFIFKNEPFLSLGRQVLLFLSSPGHWPRSIGEAGYLAAKSNGVTGPDIYLDEFILPFPLRSQLMIDGRYTTAPTVAGIVCHWRFEQGGPQIEGVPVEEALAAVVTAAQTNTTAGALR